MTFERVFWKLKLKLSEVNKELAAATLCSIAPSYVKQKGPTSPKSMLRAIGPSSFPGSLFSPTTKGGEKSEVAIGQLKKNEDIIITRPDKGSGVVVMVKSESVHLLKKASINDETKFVHISFERPSTKGRPPKHYHLLLQKEKELVTIVRRILPKPIADSLVQKGSGLPTSMAFQKRTRKSWQCVPSCRQLGPITTRSLSG